MILSNEQYFTNVEHLLAEGHEVQIRIKGHSMRPLLRSDRDMVELVAVSCDMAVVGSSPGRFTTATLRAGDLVLFRYRGRHILHRIVRREGIDFTLAGDGNYRAVEQCTEGDIIAIARRIIRPSGRVVECSSRYWRFQSTLWLALPAMVRRVILGVAWRVAQVMN